MRDLLICVTLGRLVARSLRAGINLPLIIPREINPDSIEEICRGAMLIETGPSPLADAMVRLSKELQL